MLNIKFLLVVLLGGLSFFNAHAEEAGLELEGERWVGKWTSYVCDDGNTLAVVAPAELMEHQVQFTHIGADYSLDNITIRAEFVENGQACQYSSLLTADNDAWTIELNESRAIPSSDCQAGKEVIDTTLAANNYKYLHGRAAVYVPFSNSQEACGEDNIGIHFQVTGKKE